MLYELDEKGITKFKRLENINLILCSLLCIIPPALEIIFGFHESNIEHGLAEEIIAFFFTAVFLPLIV